MLQKQCCLMKPTRFTVELEDYICADVYILTFSLSDHSADPFNRALASLNQLSPPLGNSPRNEYGRRHLACLPIDGVSAWNIEIQCYNHYSTLRDKIPIKGLRNHMSKWPSIKRHAQGVGFVRVSVTKRYVGVSWRSLRLVFKVAGAAIICLS